MKPEDIDFIINSLNDKEKDLENKKEIVIKELKEEFEKDAHAILNKVVKDKEIDKNKRDKIMQLIKKGEQLLLSKASNKYEDGIKNINSLKKDIMLIKKRSVV